MIRWKRRFENRVDVEIVTPDQDSDTVSKTRQGSVKKVFNNKVHPGNSNTKNHSKVYGWNNTVLESNVKLYYSASGQCGRV